MTRRRLGTRRSLFFGGNGTSAPSVLYLPWVGPFQVLDRPVVADLSDETFTVDTQLVGEGTADDNPLIRKNITLNAGVQLTSLTYSIFLWCDTLTMLVGSNLVTTGGSGFDASLGCGSTGGNGAEGASGGAGGDADSTASGSGCGSNFGGDGNNGSNGQGIGCGDTGGTGGQGFGRDAISLYPSLTYGSFTYDPGGTINSTPTGPWGEGGGSPPTQAGFIQAIGGGGGGAGPIVVSCRIFNGVVTNGVGLYSQGGSPGTSAGSGCCDLPQADSGANGNIYVFAQKMTGNSVGGFAFNLLKAYEVANNGTTILNTYTNDLSHTWDHS